MKAPRAGWGRARWVVLGLLVVPAVLMLAATVTLGVMVTRSTVSLSDNVRLTQNLVDGNVRTLSQAQRELLRLQAALVTDPPRKADLDLRRALASQRIQESTLDYQGLTLDSASLLTRSRSLATTWRTAVEPRVAAVTATSPAATRQAVARQVQQLELGYNQLVSDAEINRKVSAAQANEATQQLVDGTRSLLTVLGVTLLSFVALVGGTVAILMSARRRQLAQAASLKTATDQLKRHSVAVQNTDNVVLITDAEGRLEWVNDAFERSTGYSREEVVGQSPGSLLQGPETDPETVALMRSRLEAQQGFSVEIVNYTRDGEPFWAELEVTPIRDEARHGAGRVTGFVAVQSDITQRRHTEEALVRAKEAAEETARAKATFLASMSHEIRTPLNAVLGLTELLLGTELAPEQRQYVTTAHQSGRHLLALVNDILDFSALDSDTVELESAPASVHRLLDDVAAMMQPAASRSGVTLTATTDASVPRLVGTDVTRLRQVLINLVGNALKFTRDGRVDVSAAYEPPTADKKCGTLVLAVRDTGIGIPADRRERIFDPFTQGDASTTRTHGGTGLGLAICARIAAHLGGEIGVESQEGVGSTFTLRVPVCTVVRGPAPVVEDASATDRERLALTTLRVLLAEDDMVNRMVALNMLKRLGIEADVAEDGGEALEATQRAAYDVVLMDVHMPHVDGLAATRAIRERGGAQPWIVALTANALEGDRERMLAAGMDDYVSKPFGLEDLRKALSAVPLVH